MGSQQLIKLTRLSHKDRPNINEKLFFSPCFLLRMELTKQGKQLLAEFVS